MHLASLHPAVVGQLRRLAAQDLGVRLGLLTDRVQVAFVVEGKADRKTDGRAGG